MQVLEVLVTKSPKSGKLDDNWSISPVTSDRPARVLTHVVKDMRFVGDLICDEFRFSAFACLTATGVRIEIHDRRSVRRVARAVKKIIAANKDSRRPAETAATNANG